MSTAHRDYLSFLDSQFVRDPRLPNLAPLFAMSPKPRDLVELPRPSPAATSERRLSRAVHSPEVLGIVAITLLVACALVGGLLDNSAIALCGLIAPILLGVGCHLAIKRHKSVVNAGATR
jgi:hypothetical protein